MVATFVSHFVVQFFYFSLFYNKVLWRFKTNGPYYVVYDKTSGTSQFDSFLLGVPGTVGNNLNTNGFWKMDAARGGRTPQAGFFAITNLAFQYATGISEDHRQSDVWLDMWNTLDSGRYYSGADAAISGGMKCIAGYCWTAGSFMFA